MFLVVGLGNPGTKYTATRHNVGFRFIDLLAKKYNIPLKDRRAKAIVGEGRIGSHDVALAKPRTFMNHSGESIEYLLTRFGGNPTNLLIVYDEMALPAGRIRVRSSGSHAGHNGIRSIISSVQSEQFPRLRIGIGQPPQNGDSIPHVLGKFTKDEEPLIAKAVHDAVQAVECILEQNIDIAMNRFNVIGS